MATEFERYMAHGIKDNPQGTVSVIVPVKNAEKYVDRMIRYIRNNWKKKWGELEIIIVDDCSRDNTVAKAEREADLVISMAKPKGKGGCIRAGMAKARGDYRLVIEPRRVKEIDRAPFFLEWLKSGIDVAIGNRFASSRQNGYRGNLAALIAKKIADTAIAPEVSDVRSGFIAFNRHSGKKLYDESILNGTSNDAEIVGLAFRNGMKVREVSIVESNAPPVREVLRLSTAIRLIADSIKLKAYWKKLNRYQKPDCIPYNDFKLD